MEYTRRLSEKKSRPTIQERQRASLVPWNSNNSDDTLQYGDVVELATGNTRNARVPPGDVVEYRSLSWWRAGVVMIAETISLGILSLPHAIATLGFLPGVIMLIVIGAGASYTGYITHQFAQRHPHVRSYADAGYIVAGPIGRWVAEVMSITFLVFIMGAHILTFVVMLNVLTNHGTCSVIFGVSAMVLSFGFTMPRTLKGNSIMSLVSCLSISTAVIIALIAIPLARSSHSSPSATTYLITPSFLTPLSIGAVSISHIIIAFTGHVAYFQIIAEMEKPRDFPKALALLQVAAVTFYLIVGTVIYAFVGQGVASPALGSASPTVRKVCYGIAMPTIIVAGVIAAHIAAKRCYQLIWTHRGRPEAMEQKTWTARGSWYGIIGALWLISWIVAEAIPIFGELLGVIGSAFTTWFCLGFNAVLWLNLQWKAGENGGHTYLTNRRKCALTLVNVVIVLGSAAVCVLGLYGSGVAIKNNKDMSPPFSCSDNSIK